MASPRVAPAPLTADEALMTYRHLRMLMVALPAFLLVGTWYWTQMADVPFEASISGTYLISVRDVFVGAMVGTAVCLIAYKGPALEDYVLNHAGFYALFVAFVPTQLGKLYLEDPEEWPNLVKSLTVTTVSLVLVGAVFVVMELITGQWTPKKIFIALSPRRDHWLGWAILVVTFGGVLGFMGLLIAGWINADPYAPVVILPPAPEDAVTVFTGVHKWATFLLLGSLGMVVGMHAFPKQVGMAASSARWRILCGVLFVGMALGVIPAATGWPVLSEEQQTFYVEWWEVGLFAIFWVGQTFRTWRQTVLTSAPVAGGATPAPVAGGATPAA